ncbi:hypothetical protein [Nocardia fluminea]|uniref:hypothetical protein n=1 Tax=Nocardia fluminea TaxID=134984 RepID=UPI003D0C3C43
MDIANRFATPTVFRLLRLEYGVALVIMLGIFIAHLDEVRWGPAIILFAYIDVLGYIPSLFARLKSGTIERGKIHYLLYNFMHSFVTQAAVVGLWTAVYGFEWALLVVPMHLCGDRAIFGNFIKSFHVPFEPRQLSTFTEFERQVFDAAPPRPLTVGGP